MNTVEIVNPKPYSILSFIKNQVNGGVLLLVMATIAIFLANSSYKDIYFSFWQQEVYLQIGGFNLFGHNGHAMTLGQFINDVLMVLFFFVIGLEIKREILVGELSSLKKALLPIIAAIGGMIIPASIFGLVTMGDSDQMRGLAVPMATDIAFSLGILSLLGKRVPFTLKIFLTTLAVADDIGGIMVIALFYSKDISAAYLIAAFVLLFLMYLAGMKGIYSRAFYLFFGIIVWWLFIHSGIHATIAGVLIAMTIPARPKLNTYRFVERIATHASSFKQLEEEKKGGRIILTDSQLASLKSINSASKHVISPLQRIEDGLHGLINLGIMPLFAFANAGIDLHGISFDSLTGVAIGAFLGLFVGKFLGIFLFTWLGVKMKFAEFPNGIKWKELAGVSMLGGIGFTVSLFIATLAFGDPSYEHLLSQVKLGVLCGTIASGLAGYLYLSIVLPKSSDPLRK